MALTRAEALRLVGLDATHDASAIEAALGARVTALEARRASAPTPALREKYARQLEELGEAQRVLMGRGTAALEDSDLPVARPGEGGFVAPGSTSIETLRTHAGEKSESASGAHDLPVSRPGEGARPAPATAPIQDDALAPRPRRPRKPSGGPAFGRTQMIIAAITAVIIAAVAIPLILRANQEAAAERATFADARIEAARLNAEVKILLDGLRERKRSLESEDDDARRTVEQLENQIRSARNAADRAELQERLDRAADEARLASMGRSAFDLAYDDPHTGYAALSGRLAAAEASLRTQHHSARLDVTEFTSVREQVNAIFVAPAEAQREDTTQRQSAFAAIERTMVSLPAGTFLKGRPNTGRGHRDGPQRRVSIAAVAIGKYEVTFAEWDACVADGGCNGYRPDDRGWGRGSRPVINVSWEDAQAYAAWVSQRTAKRFRLPTEAEWEYAARAGTTTAYPWGNIPSHEYANYGNDECCDDMAVGHDQWVYSAPVGQFKANDFGLFDMHGNVVEMVEDCPGIVDLSDAPIDGSANTTGNCSLRMARGGSWFLDSQALRSDNRSVATALKGRSDHIGFRLARTLL